MRDGPDASRFSSKGNIFVAEKRGRQETEERGFSIYPWLYFCHGKSEEKEWGGFWDVKGEWPNRDGGYHRPGQLPHSMSERKVRVKQKESMRNAIMEDMKLAKISLCPDNEIFKKYNSYRGRTMTGPAPIR